MRVVVTGGCGFIGSYVVRQLIERGDEVRVLDVAGRTCRGADLHIASVLDGASLVPVFRGADVVVHLAGYVRDQMRRDPNGGSRLQIDGTRNVLEASERVGVARVVLASSFYVYAGDPRASVDEDAEIDVTGMEPFGLAKLASEQLCREYAARGPLSCTILRIGSAYGPGGSNAVRTFLEAGFRGESVEVWGDGQRRNQYTFVGDLADGIAATLGQPGAARVQVLNLISPAVTTTADLAEALTSEFGFVVRFEPRRTGGPSFPYMRSDKAHQLLGWRTLPFLDGLRITARALRMELTAIPR